MRISDKNLGYLVLIALLMTLSMVSFLMWNKQRSARDSVWIRFQELGSLQPEDPVTIRGFRVGKITSIRWDSAGALVKISLEAPRIFRTGTVFRNENFSLMGQRRLAIDPSRAGDITPPDYIFQGEFEPGIAEAMHLMDQVKDQVLLVRDIALLLQDGDSTQPSLPQVIESLLHHGESIIQKLDTTLHTARPVVQRTLGQVQSLSQQTIQVTQQADTTIQNLHTSLTLNINEAKQLLQNLHHTLAFLDQALTELEQHPLTHDLLYKRDFIDQIEALTQTLQQAIHKIDRQGIVLLDENGNRKSMVKLRNINLFGKTAREKNKSPE